MFQLLRFIYSVGGDFIIADLMNQVFDISRDFLSLVPFG